APVGGGDGEAGSGKKLHGGLRCGRAHERFVRANSQAELRSSDCDLRGRAIMRLPTLKPRVVEISIRTAKTPPKVA
ncbi:MAG: hypothetical protein AB7I59_28485, partial [Geminicoccaceae bacterium]